jgi:beta-galactosidase
MREVKVYSNVESVELLLNGKSLGAGTRSDDTGLRHAPFIWQVPYEPGVLRAIAGIGSTKIEDDRQTAGPAYKILLTADTDHLVSGDLDSLAYLTASVTDEKGVIVPGDHSAITFTSYGPGQLLKQAWLGHGTGHTWNAVDGKTRVAFRATSHSGRAVISAYSPGLRIGRANIDVTAPGKPDEMNYKEKFVIDELN